jgi:hypothetical protein
MLEFQLFRIKVFPSTQGDLFEKEKGPQEILREVVTLLPDEVREGFVWHVGNVGEIDDEAIYFRIGRTSKATIEVYKDGKFLDQEFSISPYTHVILDIPLEVCAIAKKTRLSRRTNGVANQLRKLLLESAAARRLAATFEISPLNDPEDFLTHLRTAYLISRFWVTFTRPNAIDAENDFIRPMERLLNESDGRKGKAEVEGEQLNPETLETLARSAAATGDDAGASIQIQRNQARTRVSLRGNAAVVAHEEPDDEDLKRGLLWKIREKYQSIREGLSK